MQKTYNQLTLDDRCEISRLHQTGQTCRQMAAALDRSPSTIARELKRNSGTKVGYKPTYAQAQARSRRWSGSRLERDPVLRETVLSDLKAGLTPQQVSGRLKLDKASACLSHESIYRFIFGQRRRTNDSHWGHYLVSRKIKRGYRRKALSSPALCIQDRRDIRCRSKAADDRQQFGHCEGDLMSFSAYGEHLLVLHERSSRLTVCVNHPQKHAALTYDAIYQQLQSMPPAGRRSLTLDNGTEFAMHYKLRDSLSMETYFCDPHSPWQKGGIENSIGRLRRYFPRRCSMKNITSQQIVEAVIHYNNIPRKCLGYKTSAEVFAHALHFECESTSPHARGRLWLFMSTNVRSRQLLARKKNPDTG